MAKPARKKEKKQTYPLTKVIGACALAVIIISIIQWFFLYPDPSQLFLGVVGGLSLLLGAYLYNWAKDKEKEDERRDKEIRELSVV